MMDTAKFPVTRYKKANIAPLMICKINKTKLSRKASPPLKKLRGLVCNTANNSVESNAPVKTSPFP